MPSQKAASNEGARSAAVIYADASLSTDWPDPIDFGLVAGRFNLRNLTPRLPADGVDLRDVLPPDASQGRYESWEDVRHRAESHASQEFGYNSPHPYRSISQEARLLVGTLALPERLLTGAQIRLFGGRTDNPSTWQVHAVAFALFNPPMAFWAGESWADVCHRAEFYAKRRERITAQVKALLALGE